MKTIKGVPITHLTPVAVFFTLGSLVWTGYSIIDLMSSGAWGLAVALSVDGLWAVVQYLDYRGIGGRTVHSFGWGTLAAACVLLGYHGSNLNPDGPTFTIDGWTINVAAALGSALPPIVAKVAWIGDIRLRRDPTELTPDQETEINGIIRDAEYIARKKMAEIERDAAEEIALIQAQAKVTLARDEADFRVGMERLHKRHELERRSPLALSRSYEPITEPITADQDHEQLANSSPVSAVTSANAAREQPIEGPSISDLAREQIAITEDNKVAVASIMAARPDANKESVAAAVRRARKTANGTYL